MTNTPPASNGYASQQVDENAVVGATTVGRGALVNALSLVVLNALSLAVNVVLTNVLGAADFGLFYLANTIAILFGTVAALGVNQGVMAFVPRLRGMGQFDDAKAIVRFALIVTAASGAILAIGLYLGSPAIAARVFHKPALVVALGGFAVLVVFKPIFDVLVATLQGLQDIFLYSALVNVVQPLLRLLGVVALMLAVSGMLAAVYGTVLSYLGCAVLAGWVLYRKGIFCSRWRSGLGMQLVSFSWPLTLESLLVILGPTIPVMLLGLFSTAGQVGIYGVVARLGALVSFSLLAVNSIFPAFASELVGRGDNESLARVYKVTTRWTLGASLLMLLVYCALGGNLLRPFGRSFVTGFGALIVYSFGELLKAGVGSAGYLLMVAGHTSLNALNAIAFVAADLVLSWLLIPSHGSLGAAIAYASSIGCVNVLRLLELQLLEKVHPFSWSLGKPVGAALVSFGLLGIVRVSSGPVGLAGAMGELALVVLVYGFGLYLAGLEDGEKALLKVLAARMRLFA